MSATVKYLIELNNSIYFLAFFIFVVLVINIILWSYFVKVKRLVLNLTESIKSISYNTGDFPERFKEIHDILKGDK